jgi:signal transduction histidine kinase
MFQPETGSLSLNLNVTKHLFQALGGKLIVRQRPQAGEVMTIFLPLEVRNSSSNQEGILV